MATARELRPDAYGAGRFSWGTHDELPSVPGSREYALDRGRHFFRLCVAHKREESEACWCPQAEDGIIAREDLPFTSFFMFKIEELPFSYFAFGYNHIWN
ncbi:MAG TPA: hypothetical protein VI794_01515 [Patescibacteria group bacterium]|nr:hypothetical protein [Patescibacteria group bacterium]